MEECNKYSSNYDDFISSNLSGFKMPDVVIINSFNNNALVLSSSCNNIIIKCYLKLVSMFQSNLSMF